MTTPVQRLLQINMAALAALGALLLGMGARTVGPPLLVMAAAALSVWLTDVTGRFSIGRRTSNALMVVASVIALQELLWIRSELQALNFAWLLIFLQVVLLFQQKNAWTYWLLVTLSLLEVVIATLFSQGVWFGLLLAIYMLLGFSTMTLLLMYRQLADWHVSHAGSPSGDSSAALSGELFRLLGRMGLQTLGLTLVLFFAVPRFGQFTWQGTMVRPQPLTGFSENVKLGQMGEVLESREEVMRVRFERLPDGAPQPVQGDMYLQGTVLLDYQHGQWSRGTPTSKVGSAPLQRESFSRRDVVRQRITIEGMDHDELFFVAPYVAIESHIGIEVDHATERLLRNPFLRGRRFEYRLGTTAFVRGEQSPLNRALPENADLPQGINTVPRDGPDALPNLVALANRWIAESRLPRQDRAGRARYLEGKLARSGQFRYSLVGQERDPKLDPIEDFVTKHPVGHCEYFATALALMLRSQGIPARVVCGYKIDHDAWDPLGNYYLVRQYHAHAWVEAYLRPSQTPTELMHGDAYWHWRERGGWLRLDPTPSGADTRLTTWFVPVRRSMDWIDSAWSNYFVELDCQRQRDAIYGPIAQAATSVWQAVTNGAWWRALLNSRGVQRYLARLNREAAWVLVCATGVLLACAVASITWGLIHLILYLRGRRRDGPRGGRRCPANVEFYRRFETLLARQGLVRAPGQTQQEFAAVVAAYLAKQTGDAQLATLPATIADAFYRVRFGRTPLDNLQTQTVELALVEIAAARPPSRGGGMPGGRP